MSDPRKGLPSASRLHRLVHCPGSERLIKRHINPDKEGDKTGASKFGVDVHAAIAGDDSKDLTVFQDKIKKQSLDIYAKLLKKYIDEPVATIIESRCWMVDHDTGEEIFSAQIDRATTDGKGTWLVADFKTLPGDHDPAPDNYQIMGCCASLHNDIRTRNGAPMSRAYGVIIQPSITENPVPVKYDDRALMQARAQITDAICAAQDRHAPRIPGKWCNMCPVSAHCMESKSMLPIVGKQMDVDTLTSEQMLWLWDRFPAIIDIIKRVESRIKAQLRANPDSVPGLRLSVGEGRRTIRDAQGAYAILKEHVTKDQFKTLLSVPIGELTSIFAESYTKAHNCTKEEAVAAFNKLIEPVVSKMKPPETIERVK